MSGWMLAMIILLVIFCGCGKSNRRAIIGKWKEVEGKETREFLKDTFDVELKKASKNGLLRDTYFTSEKSNAHFMRGYRIISHQRYNVKYHDQSTL